MTNSLTKLFALLLTVLILFQLVPCGVLAAEESGAPQGDITITFAINNPSYTLDPGSGYTHLTSPEAYVGGDLLYNKVGSSYRVSGTGTVCSYIIESGSTLADNGLTPPNLSTMNIAGTTPGNTYEYLSVRNWITEDGLICNKDTVFTEDTTLYLSLFVEGEDFTSNFICCDEHESSFSFYCGYSSPTFKLGNSIAENLIYDYETVNAHFPSTNHDTTHFAGWQLKNTATGEFVPFTAGTPITEEYALTEGGMRTVNIYPLWQEPPVTVTATFMNGETTVDERTLTLGDELGELPDVSDDAPEGEVFLGWQYTTADSTTAYATPSTVITADTVYTAVFGAVGFYNVVFHDIMPDGTESFSIDMSVAEGTAFANIEDASLGDGEMISDCIWYTLEGGVKTPFDITSGTVTENIDLFTYSHELVLTILPPVMNAMLLRAIVEVDTAPNGTMTMTITAREGEPIAASDFVIDGIDYTKYTWAYEDDLGASQTLNIPALITSGLTDSISATSNGTLSVPGATPATGHNVFFYVFVDGERVLVKNQAITTYVINHNGTNRHFISAATLAAVYGPYGFKASDLQPGTRYFPHVDYGRADIWADTPVKIIDGVAFSPATTSKGNVEIYYLPNQTVTTKMAWRTILANRTDNFYTVSVVDPETVVYTPETLPEPICVFNGETVTVTVSNVSRQTGRPVIWNCISDDEITAIPPTDNGDGTVTFTINNIQKKFVISHSSLNEDFVIRYNINRPNAPFDPEYAKPTVMGEDFHTVTLDATTESHIVLAPSVPSYFYSPSNKYLGKATFIGWAVNGDTTPANLILPGTVLDLSQYPTRMIFEAQWITEYASNTNKTGPMVNFFVALNAATEGVAAWAGNIESSFFTKSVYTDNCGINTADALALNLFGSVITVNNQRQYIVLGETNAGDLSLAHQTLVNSLTNGYTVTSSVDGHDYTYQMTFPTDEDILRSIRKLVREGAEITVNGDIVQADDLTVDNFTVKWHIFKYDISDGWHIDGLLVAKTGKMLVNKTFAGDSAIVSEIKSGNYYIEVTAEAGAPHTGGILTLDNATEYDPATDTYSWLIDVDQHYNYTLKEYGYLPSNQLAEVAASYTVHNSELGQDVPTAVPFDPEVGVQVFGETPHNLARMLNVGFRNTYLKPGELSLRKVDATTGRSMGGVEFELYDTDGNHIYLYDLGNGHYSSIPANDGPSTDTNVAVTNSSGMIFVDSVSGTYILRERTPEGYLSPGDITVVVGVDLEAGTIFHESATSSNTDHNYVEVAYNSREIIVTNHPEKVNLTVEKIWTNNENKSVDIELYRDGERIGALATLDGVVDGIEIEPWKCVFTDLPLIVDGQPAAYHIKEERIGEFHYSPEENGDGYRYYDVAYSSLIFRDADGNPTEDKASAASLYLSVTNTRRQGSLTVYKVDQHGNPVPGATFKLFDIETSLEQLTEAPLSDVDSLRTVNSDAYGIVSFGTVNEGQYYMAEYQAPAGYNASNVLFRVQTYNNTVTMEKWDATSQTWIQCNDLRVVNECNDVTITKYVSGTMGDKNKAFQFSVTSTERMASNPAYTLSASGLTATFTLKHGQTMTLHGVPVGAELTITELNAQAYTTVIKVGEETVSGAVIAGVNTEVTVTNTRDVSPDTGLLLDTLPYVIILAGVVAVAVVLIVRSRRGRDD